MFLLPLSTSSLAVRIQHHAVKSVLLCTLVAITGGEATAAEAYRPAGDDEVLETLPKQLLNDWAKTTTLRRKLASDPQNAKLASQVAAELLSIGNQQGDPRFYGYARAALKPWWQAKTAEASILRLRAKLKEKDHLYDEALADLQLLIEQDPRNVQAWVEMANIHRVLGQYAEALRACETLSEIAGPERTLLCRIPIQAVTGEAEQAYRALEATLPAAKEQWPAAVQWVLTMQAKIARALGRDDVAERHLREGLANDSTDFYMIREYADFLLDHDRNEEALSLAREHTNDNGILLRIAIAARRCNEPELAMSWQNQLQSRFEEIRLRGNQPHGRFESRYYLELKDDAQQALTIALANWEKQKEARDTRNVLEAALAAGNAEAAQPVIAFLQKHDTEDVVLSQIVEQLKELE